MQGWLIGLTPVKVKIMQRRDQDTDLPALDLTRREAMHLREPIKHSYIAIVTGQQALGKEATCRSAEDISANEKLIDE